MNQHLRLGRILETSLYADDLDSAESFYTSVLGLELYAKEIGRHLFFKCGDQMLLIFNPARTITETEVGAHGAKGPGHMAFAMPLARLDECAAFLKSKGIDIERDVHWPKGGRSLYFRDPAGNSIELASPLLWEMRDA